MVLASLRRATTTRRAALLLTLGAALALSAQGPTRARAATNGRIAFEVPPDLSPSIETVNPDGTIPQAVPGIPIDSANPAWSADGTRLAFSSTVAGSNDVYVVNGDGTGLHRVTADPVAALDPTWSPDGRDIAFTSWRNGLPNIYLADLASGAIRRLTSDPGVDQQPRWSPDGRSIAFASNRTGSFGIWTMAPDGSDQRALTVRPGPSTDPAWSPDGTKLAYTYETNGLRSIYSIDRSGLNGKRLSNGLGTDQFPAWSPDGSQIAFTRGGALYAMPSSGEASAFSARLLFAVGVDSVWAPLPAPLGALTAGTATIALPGSASQTISSSTPLKLPTGTRVNATAGEVVVSFKRQGVSATTPQSIALVQFAAFEVVKRTPENLSLRLNPPACGSRAASAARRRSRHNPTARVTGGHYTLLTNEITAGSHGTDYRVVESCRGTLVRVTQGLVLVRLRHGRHQMVRVRGGHSYFAPARGG